jgi:hypothetical protein
LLLKYPAELQELRHVTFPEGRDTMANRERNTGREQRDRQEEETPVWEQIGFSICFAMNRMRLQDEGLVFGKTSRPLPPNPPENAGPGEQSPSDPPA